MKKSLKIKVTCEREDTISFQIASQSHRGDLFGSPGKFKEFQATNGVLICSYGFPQIYAKIPTAFYVRGMERRLDKRVVKTTKENFKLIEEAIAEYNKFFSKEND